ncbi:MAG: Lrp/AsnC family transcriptional regulator, partial [Gemmatimonadaceae bacterium]
MVFCGSANTPKYFRTRGGPMELDRTDFALVEALQHDARQRLEDLGRRVGMAPSSVHERLRRLEAAGVIRRWTVEC